MDKMLYVLCVLMILASCNSVNRTPVNQVASDQEPKLITDPSGDQAVTVATDNEPAVLFVDCGPRMAPMEDIVLDGRLDEFGNPVSTVIEAPESDQKPIDLEACSYNCNGDDVLDCKDLSCQPRGSLLAAQNILTNYNITCSNLDTGLEIYKPPLEPQIMDLDGGEPVVNKVLEK